MGIIAVILVIFGVLIGLTISYMRQSNERVTGVVQIDHNSGLCRFKVTNDTLSDLKIKKVLFYVEHDAVINDIVE